MLIISASWILTNKGSEVLCSKAGGGDRRSVLYSQRSRNLALGSGACCLLCLSLAHAWGRETFWVCSWPRGVEALMLHGIAGGKMSYCVQSAGIRGVRSYPSSSKWHFFHFWPGLAFATSTPIFTTIFPLMFCTFCSRRCRLSQSVQPQMMVYPWILCVVLQYLGVWGCLSPKSSRRSLAQC